MIPNVPHSGKIWRSFIVWQFGSLENNITKLNCTIVKCHIPSRLATHFKIYVYSPENVISGVFSLGRTFMSRMTVWGFGLAGANHSPRCSKAVSPQSEAKYKHALEERAKMGRHALKNSPATTRLLDTSLSFQMASSYEVYVIVVTSFFGWGTKSP